MSRRARAPAASSLAVVVVTAPLLLSCNAVLGLGDPPRAEETPASATSSASTSSGGASSGGGAGTGGEGLAATTGGAGPGGSGGSGSGTSTGGNGAGGSGGSDVVTPCGSCRDGAAACGPGGTCVEGVCVVRVVELEGGDGSGVVQGIAVSPSTILVGAAIVPSNSVVYSFIDRATWVKTDTPPENIPADGILVRGEDVSGYYATTAVDGRVVRIDPDGVGPVAVLPSQVLRGVTWVPGATPAGAMVGISASNGDVLLFDLATPTEPCTIAGSIAPGIDLAPRFGSGWVWSLAALATDPSWSSTPRNGCTKAVSVTVPAAAELATITSGDGFVALRQRQGGGWEAITTVSNGAALPTNDGWGLQADGDGLYVPRAGAGLDRCDADLAVCVEVAPSTAMGEARDVARLEGGLLVTDRIAGAAPKVRLLCIADESPPPR